MRVTCAKQIPLGALIVLSLAHHLSVLLSLARWNYTYGMTRDGRTRGNSVNRPASMVKRDNTRTNHEKKGKRLIVIVNAVAIVSGILFPFSLRYSIFLRMEVLRNWKFLVTLFIAFCLDRSELYYVYSILRIFCSREGFHWSLDYERNFFEKTATRGIFKLFTLHLLYWK